MEVLAPAGSYNAFIAAIDSGADAVYLAGPKFGARKYASNFTMDMMEEAVEYAHQRMVKVYVTVNTLIFDEEFAEVMRYIDELYLMHVDAVIMQDIGLISVVRKLYPDLPIHGSTQMSAFSVEDFKYLQELGLERIVVPREMTIEEIKELKEKIDVELEVFVHGALCYSVSGQCLMSSFKGGRSGNRGMCAQPCRHYYEDGDKEGYLLSPRDLNSLEQVETLKNMGVESIKIEGRMKRDEYVAEVVEAYRHAVDGEESIDLSKVFNRQYTKGFLGNEFLMQTLYPGHFGEVIGLVDAYKDGKMYFKPTMPLSVNDEIQIRRGLTTVGARVEYITFKGERIKQYEGEEVISIPMKYPCEPGEVLYRTIDEQYYKQSKQRIHDRTRRSKVTVNATFSTETGAQMTVSGFDHTVTLKDAELVQQAQKRPISSERVMEQLLKVGDLPIQVNVESLVVSDDAFMPISALNHFRVKVYEAFLSSLVKYEERSSKKYRPLHLRDTGEQEVLWRATCRTKDQYDALIEAGIEDVLMIGHEFNENGIYPLRMHKGAVSKNGYAVQWGDLRDNHRVSRHLNVTNTESVKALLAMGASSIEASVELNSRQLKEISETYPNVLEIMVYGRIPAMVLRHCPHIDATCNRCGACQDGNVMFENKDGSKYYLAPSADEFCELYMNEPVYLGNEQGSLNSMDVKAYRFDFLYETKEQIEMIIDAFEQEINLSVPSHKGHFRLGAK